jgi:hypothetical protein
VGLARTLLTFSLLVACATSVAAGAAQRSVFAPVRDNDMRNFEARSLAFHNRLRAQVGTPPLQWSPSLAAAAANYGPPLAALNGPLMHSPAPLRVGQGENLWKGTAGAYSLENMLGSWGGESRWFRPGIFPAVSTTGNWAHVGHYTQMIWRTTTHVGCALHRERGWDYLICRYSPMGNVLTMQVP